MNVIFLGPPGAGKGTLAEPIREKFNLEHLSTGDMLRAEIKMGTELGTMAKEYMDKGALVPNEVIIGMVENRLKLAKGGILFDGFPRTVEQADALSKVANIDAVINISVPLDVVVKRICSRRVCPDCGKVYNTSWYNDANCEACGTNVITRADDNEETVKERYNVYIENTQPLIEYYKNKGLLHTICSEVLSENIEAVSGILGNL